MGDIGWRERWADQAQNMENKCPLHETLEISPLICDFAESIPFT